MRDERDPFVVVDDRRYLVEFYRVGVLKELWLAYRCARFGRLGEACRRLRRIPGMWRRRSAWNGYLAEPQDLPLFYFHRCGHGWTRRRALADLNRHLREVNCS